MAVSELPTARGSKGQTNPSETSLRWFRPLQSDFGLRSIKENSAESSIFRIQLCLRRKRSGSAKRTLAAPLARVLARLREDYARSGRSAVFEQLQYQLWGPDKAVPHRELGQLLGMTEGAVKVAVHRVRGRFRELLLDEVAQTVESPAEVEEELRQLLNAVSC